jgi:prephenate dehydrogenase
LEEAREWLDAGAEPGTDDAGRLIQSADLVVLAAPVGAIDAMLPKVLGEAGPQAAITDCGSVKQPIVAGIATHPQRSRFVAGHPMAGREIGGFAAASSGLFEGARWYLVREGAAPDAFDRASALARVLGAAVVEVGAEEHDRAMAYVSHLPQLVASALVDIAAAASALADAGPGFRDTTRIAGGPDAVWSDIFRANACEVAKAMDELVSSLSAARDELVAYGRQGDRSATLDRTMTILERARRARGSSD